jgi:hypothetical protein
MGVSGGGGEPRVALVVEVDAVELMRLIISGSRAFNLAYGSPPLVVGGGKNCCAAAGRGAETGAC